VNQRVTQIGNQEIAQVLDNIETLKISTLQELEQALNEGRLARVPGFGTKKLETMRMGLAEMLHPQEARPLD
jgi:DNA polymerase/3'-5' exonuclease PolX